MSTTPLSNPTNLTLTCALWTVSTWLAVVIAVTIIAPLNLTLCSMESRVALTGTTGGGVAGCAALAVTISVISAQFKFTVVTNKSSKAAASAIWPVAGKIPTVVAVLRSA